MPRGAHCWTMTVNGADEAPDPLSPHKRGTGVGEWAQGRGGKQQIFKGDDLGTPSSLRKKKKQHA